MEGGQQVHSPQYKDIVQERRRKVQSEHNGLMYMGRNIYREIMTKALGVTQIQDCCTGRRYKLMRRRGSISFWTNSCSLWSRKSGSTFPTEVLVEVFNVGSANRNGRHLLYCSGY